MSQSTKNLTLYFDNDINCYHYKFDTFTTRYMYRHVYQLAMAGQNIAAAIFCQSKKLFLFFIDNQPSLILFCFILYILAQIIIYSYMKSKNSEHQVCLYVICTLYVTGSLCCICFIEQMFICWKKVQFKVDQFIHFLFSFVKMYRNCKYMYMHMCIICIQKECSFS